MCRRPGNRSNGGYANLILVDPNDHTRITYDSGCCFVHNECKGKFTDTVAHKQKEGV